MIDATIVRAHACAAGYGDQTKEVLGRSKGGFTTKIHAKVDALGNPLKFIVTPGQSSNFTKTLELIGHADGSYLVGDRGYDSDDICTQIYTQKCIPIIPGKTNRKITSGVFFLALINRFVILLRFFLLLEQFYGYVKKSTEPKLLGSAKGNFFSVLLNK